MLDFPKEDIRGKKYGDLEVIEEVKRGTNNYWECSCKCLLCGKSDIYIRSYTLKNGRKSNLNCGCTKLYFDKQRGKNSSFFKGCEEMGGAYVSISKRRAKKIEVDFNISANFMWELYIRQGKRCALSGVPINFSTRRKIGTASLDRIDPSKGYTRDNVQWLHKTVNLIKMNLTQDEFIEWCKKIATFIKIY